MASGAPGASSEASAAPDSYPGDARGPGPDGSLPPDAAPLDSSLDAGPLPDAPPDAPLPGACDPVAAASIYLADTDGAIYRFSPGADTIASLGAPDCSKMLLPTLSAIAVGVDGRLWLVSTAGVVVVVDPAMTPLTCVEQLPMVLAAPPPPRAAFLPAVPPASDPLYVAEGSTLVSLDPSNSVVAPVGAFDVKSLLGLSATADGRLFAVRGSTMAASAELDLVDPGDGVVSTTLMVPLSGASSFAGGAALGQSFYLFSEVLYYALDLTTYEVSMPMKYPGMMPGIVAVGSAPCAPM